jgi:hypothetical protein
VRPRTRYLCIISTSTTTGSDISTPAAEARPKEIALGLMALAAMTGRVFASREVRMLARRNSF